MAGRMWIRTVRAVARACTACMCMWLFATASRAENDTKAPDGFRLIFSEDFDVESSLAKFEMSDSKAWRWSQQGKTSGALELFQQSKYQPKFRSPVNMAMIASQRCGDFVLEVDMKQSGKEYAHRDMCVFFDFQSPTKFYYTHLATTPDANAHNIFIVNQAARQSFAPIASQGIDWGSDWQHVRVERLGDAIRVFYHDMTEPVIEANHTEFREGYVGVGSFDDTGLIDNVRLWAAETRDGQRPLFVK